MKANFWYILIVISIIACDSKRHRKSAELIIDPVKQDTIFHRLLTISDNVPAHISDDSLAFLILPLRASCPFCRKRTIENIVKKQKQLNNHQFVIISLNGGRKAIAAYFREQNLDLPVINNKLFLDSTDQAFHYDLYTDKPTIYYTYKKKAYKKVAAMPNTVKHDLRDFFSAYHNIVEK